MLVSTFFFSGTGNTRWVAEELNRLIIQKGNESRVYSIEKPIEGIEKIISDSDLIGFAYPVYGAKIPAVMLNFIETVKATTPRGTKKQLFMASTAGYSDAFGPIAAKRLLRGSGLQLKGYISLKISNNISTPALKADPTPKDKLPARLSRAHKVLNSMVDNLAAGKSYIKNIGPYLVAGIFIRRFFAESLKNCYQILSVNTDTCNKCMACVKNCPTGSISYKDGEFRFSPSCTACMRCYNFCPTYSIYHTGKYADPDVFMRYKGPFSLR